MSQALFDEFGKQLRAERARSRETLDQMGFRVFGTDGRKGYVSRVENGKQPITPLTIGKFVAAYPALKNAGDALLGIALPDDDSPSDLDRNAQRLLTEKQGLENQLRLSESLIVALAYKYAEGNPTDLESALRGLERALEIAAHSQAQGALPSNHDDAVDAVIAEADRLTQEGELDAALAVLRDDMAARKAAIAQQDAALEKVRAKALDAAILARSVAGAVAVVLDGLPDGAGRFDALRAVFREWYERGRDRGLAFDLEVAIALADASRELAGDADARGTALNDLGTALATLGERETGTARLEAAVEAYTAALKEWTRDRVPLQWATTQNNLGTALRTLGERESGTARLEAAVEAYTAALKEYTRDRVPLQWATTQNNLGAALQTLGERETGTARLEAAVEAYTAALKEWTRDRVPLQWAGTQNNLGNALATLGERESGSARLEAAVEAYTAALKERTRDRVPLDWAMTQNNLGIALRTLGARETGTARLEAAVEAYTAALMEWTRDRVPMQWASTQNNLAGVEMVLSARTGDAALLDRAEGRLAAAAEVFGAAGATQYAGMVTQAQAQLAAQRDAGP